MAFTFLQRLVRRLLPGGRHASAAERYREYNGRMFASFHEQERMLADQARMGFYHAAIRRHIRPGDRVIDLGTGTGILAALAARAGAGQVYAIDHSPILAHARTLAAANGIERVEFTSTHSTAFTTPERVDVILHEQIGDWLFDEAMVANVIDLRDRLLKPGGLILPAAFEFHCEPMQVRDAAVVPFIWELNVHGYDYSPLAPARPDDPGYFHLVSSDPSLIDHLLTRPEPALTFDLHTIKDGDLPRELVFTRPVVNPGRLDGFAVYFRARAGTDLELTSDPLDPRRARHWGFRILRTEREPFAAGDSIEFRLTVDRWEDPQTWRWHHRKRPAAGAPG